MSEADFIAIVKEYSERKDSLVSGVLFSKVFETIWKFVENEDAREKERSGFLWLDPAHDKIDDVKLEFGREIRVVVRFSDKYGGDSTTKYIPLIDLFPYY